MNNYRRFTHFLIIAVLLAAILVSALPVIAQGGVMVRPGYNLSLRAQADRNAASLGTIPFDTLVAATAISTDRNWVAVNYNGQGGWISLQYTAVDSGRLGDLPVSNQTFTLGGTGGGATSPVNVRMTINLRYRTSPDLAVQPAGAIPYMMEVPALALSSDGLFVLVNYLGQNVWVYRQYVEEVSGSLSQFTPGAAPISGGGAPATPTSDLSIGSSVNGAISDAAPSVNYTIALNAGDVINIFMDRTSGNLDAFLTFLDPNGAPVAADDDGGEGLNSFIGGYTAPTAGLYTIQAGRYLGTVTAFNNTTGNFRLSVTGSAGAAPATTTTTTTTTTTGARSGIFITFPDWHNQLPGDIRAASADSAQVVVNVNQALNFVATCGPYVNSAGQTIDIIRNRVSYQVQVVLGENGQQLGQQTFMGGDPPGCPGSAQVNTTLNGDPPAFSDALGWIRGIYGG